MPGVRHPIPQGAPGLPGGQGGRKPQTPGGGAGAGVRGDEAYAYWTAPEQELVYGAANLTPIPGAVAEARFETGLQDLRQDLRDKAGYSAQAQGVENVLFGVSLDLFLDVRITAYGAAAADYRVFAYEFGAAVDPRLGDPTTQCITAIYTAPVDVTLQFNQGAFFMLPVNDFRSILRFTPVGPLRYWGLGILFSVFNNAASVRSTRVSGALH